MDNCSIQHTRWNCTYHVVWIPKYRKKILYGEVRKDLGEVVRKLCEMKDVVLIEEKACIPGFWFPPLNNQKKITIHNIFSK